MEELLIVIVEFLLEILFQVLAELPWELMVGVQDTKRHEEAGPAFWVVLSLIAGACIGGISLLIFPTTLLHSGTARMVNLLVAPAVSAMVSFMFSRWKGSDIPKGPDPKPRSLYAACFTFALALIRFAYATRPH